MNRKQKIVTVVALALFWLSCLVVPWELTDGAGHRDTVKHATIFKAPSGGSWKKRRPSVRTAYTWGALLASYGLIVLLLANPKENRISEQEDGARP